MTGSCNPATRSEFSPPWVEVNVTKIIVDTWLYGSLSQYGGEARQPSFANLKVELAENSTLADLLAYLEMPTEVRGITFINGDLSAMPGLQPDLDHMLHHDDRVAFFDPKSMWPFQYRHGVAMIGEMSEAMQNDPSQGLHHSYGKDDDPDS
jgi:hypothetical protein